MSIPVSATLLTMIETDREIPARMLVPMCPGCGDTRVVSDDGTQRYRCRRCGHDLYTDRPRSYAAMEGLLPDAGRPPMPVGTPCRKGLFARARAGILSLRVKLGIR